MPNYYNNGLPGVVDSDGFCFRYTDKSVTQNEQYMFSNFWREQINTYGTLVTYYVNAYDVNKDDNFYGEDPTRKFAPGVNIVMAIDLAENANTLTKFGFQADDEITAYIHISSFYDKFYDLGIELLRTETSANSATIDTENSFINPYDDSQQCDPNPLTNYDIRTEKPGVYETQFNQIQPKAGDVFTLTEYGQGRPGNRSGYNYEVTEVLDQDISRTNQLAGHYIWIIKAKRFDYSFEPGLSAEKGSDQVYDNAFNGILSGGTQDVSVSKKYNQQDPLLSVNQVGTTVVFDMTANNATDVYGGY
jgi:hypothetical protein